MKNFSDYILWTQSSSTSGDDILLVDGKYLASADGEEYFSYISLFTDNDSNWKPLFENKTTHKNTNKKGLSRSLSIYQNNDGCTLVKSLFLESDETGRKIAYLFCCHSLNLMDVIASLNKASSFIGRSINTSDIAMISTLRYKKYILIVSLLFVFIILSYVLWIVLK